MALTDFETRPKAGGPTHYELLDRIEGGGSLTIFATALVETGSTGDGVTYEEYDLRGV